MIYDLHSRDWNKLTTVLVILLGEWNRSTELEDGYGKETGEGKQFWFWGSRAG